MSKKILLWGGGAKAMLALELFNLKNVIIFDPFIKKLKIKTKSKFFNKYYNLNNIIKQCSKFHICIGGMNGQIRSLIAKKLISKKLSPISLIHKDSLIHKSVSIGKMVMIMPNVVINPFVKIGDYSVINTSAVVEHDCILGSGIDIMGSASIAGNCNIKNNATVGTNATIFPNITLGENSFVGSGSVVRKNIKKNEIVVGNPAKFLKINSDDNKFKMTVKKIKLGL